MGKSLLVFPPQNDTKPVKMMQQKSKFSIAAIPEANLQVMSFFYLKIYNLFL